VLNVTTSGALCGAWDAARIAQLLANLLGNAVQYGTPETPITFTVAGEATDVVIRVSNRGTAISASDLRGLFNPLKRLTPGEAPSHNSTNLGLGLYIAERIVTAHGGTIDVTSTSEAGTIVTVRLPR
jgi:signal transduction histidine kinase